jgi:23S rRNA (cytosine1962-C5)-methyltransferase
VRPELQQALDRAAARRAPLRAEGATNAFRWVNGEGDGLPGLAVDGFADVCVLSLYRPLTPKEEIHWAEAVLKVCGARSVYLKRRPREAHSGAKHREEVAPLHPLAGVPSPECEAMELGLRYRIRPAEGLAVGLYLDMREVRGWLKAQVQGKSVFNGFAYTCGFGLAARAGGAVRVLNVDASKRVLEWGRENARLNGLPAPEEDFTAGEVFDLLRRLARRGERFDRVVLDPPSFSTVDRRRFSAAKDYRLLVTAAAAAVAPGGMLLACCNLAALTPSAFEAVVTLGLHDGGREIIQVERLGPSTVDFPLVAGGTPGLKATAFTLG